MALPYLVKYIYNNATEETVTRGKRIFNAGYVEMINYDELSSSVTFRTRDDVYNTYYKVYINRFANENTISVRCTCPYNLGEVCRHEAGALLRLQEIIEKNELDGKEPDYDQQHTTIKIKQLDIRTLRLYASPENLELAEVYVRKNKINIEEAVNDIVKASVKMDGQKFQIIFHRNEEKNLDTSCICKSEIKHPLCIHKTIVLLHLLNTQGANFFESIANRDKDKNKLLALYGYSLEDDLNGKFEFTLRDGRPFLKVLDSSIKRISTPLISKPSYMQTVLQEKVDTPTIADLKKLGIVFSFNAKEYPYIQVETIQGDTNDENNGFVGKIEKLDLS